MEASLPSLIENKCELDSVVLKMGISLEFPIVIKVVNSVPQSGYNIGIRNSEFGI